MNLLKAKIGTCLVLLTLSAGVLQESRAQDSAGTVSVSESITSTVPKKKNPVKKFFSNGLKSFLRLVGHKTVEAPKAPVCEKVEEVIPTRNCDNVGKGPGQYCVTVQFSGGRLGNQLFEVATALSIAKDKNCIAVFPMLTEQNTWNTMDTMGYAPEKLFKGYLGEEENAIFSKQRLGAGRDETSLDCFKKTFVENVKVRRRHYSRDVGEMLPAKIIGAPGKDMLAQSWSKKTGWGSFKFMSYKIFDHNKEYIQQVLGPSEAQKNAMLDKFEGLGLQIRGKRTCTIHVRRGDRDDFKWKMLYPSPPKKYYKKAIAEMEEIMGVKGTPIDTYIVLSDDIAYAEKMFKKSQPDLYNAGKFFFVDFKKHKQRDYDDLWLMSLANNNIIGNSTFSYWGAYLNTNPAKVVIQPKVWFGPAPKAFGIKVDNNGISPDDWISIK